MKQNVIASMSKEKNGTARAVSAGVKNGLCEFLSASGRWLAAGVPLFVFFLFASFANAQSQSSGGGVINFGIPPFLQESTSIPGFIRGFYDYALSIAAGLAVVMIVYGGVKYVMSGGNEAAKSDAMDILKNAIFGVVLLFGGFIILYTINPNLVQLKNPGLTSLPPLPPESTSTAAGSLDSMGSCVIGAKPTTGAAPLTVSFSILSKLASYDTDDQHFTWNFGDINDPIYGSGITATHTFKVSGPYTVQFNRTLILNHEWVQGESCSAQITIGTAGTISAELQKAAQALQNSGVSFSGTGECGGVTPGQNISDMAAGNYPRVCSCDCPSTCPVGGSSGTVAVTLSLLTGLTHVRQGGVNFQINSLTGDKHSCSTGGDPHYQGRAADVVPMPRTSDIQKWSTLFSALQSNGGSPHYECPGVFSTDISDFRSRCYSGGSTVSGAHIHVEF
jgi:hypothetical protein